MKPYRKFGKWFQIRWKEKLGRKECPYLYRWVFIFCGFSIRLHHWIASDDRRYFHDHSCDFISIVINGGYTNVMPYGKLLHYGDPVVRRMEVKALSMWKSKATQQHFLDIPKGGAWTLLLCGRPYHKWGFYVKGKKVRPLKYFDKYGVIQDKDYQ